MSESFLDRFVSAQAAGEYETALAEMKAGRKRSHWIWYIFPQLAGLGMSSMSQAYAIRDREEAIAYLKHPLLSERLLEISTVAARQLREGAPLVSLMGSAIDASKLVSSMTLFAEVARGLPPATRSQTITGIADAAETVLTAAEAEGHPRCAFTLKRLRS